MRNNKQQHGLLQREMSIQGTLVLPELGPKEIIKSIPSAELGALRDGEGEAKVKEIAARLQQSGALFSDEEFPPSDRSLFCEHHNPKFLRGETIKWLRPTEFLEGSDYTIFKQENGKNVLDSGDISQGSLADCYLIAALASCSLRPSLVTDLVIEDYLAQGLIGVKFFSEGTWTTIIVDDTLPCIEESGVGWRPIFARSNSVTPYILWGSFMEKAWAKLHGGYENIQNGNIADTLVYLTAGNREEFNFSNDETWELIKTGKFWAMLTEASEQQNDPSLPFASFLSASGVQGEAVQSTAGADTEAFAEEEDGLIEDHGYSILRVVQFRELQLMLVCNPWGSFTWKGDFSPESDKWTIAIKAAVDYNTSANIKGAFWMTFDDFSSKFAFISLTRTFEPGVELARVGGEWKTGISAGGRKFAQLQKYNPLFLLTPTTTAGFVVELEVAERRSLSSRYRDYPPVEIRCYRVSPETNSVNLAAVVFSMASQQRCRTKIATLDPEKGPYLFIAMNWHSGCPGQFWLSLSSPGSFTLERLANPSPSSEDGELMKEFSPQSTCVKCNEPLDALKEPVRSTWGFLWHPDCWECHGCNRPFGRMDASGQVFHIDIYAGTDAGFCKQCYKNNFFPKCHHCKERIVPSLKYSGAHRIHGEDLIHEECWSEFVYSLAEKCAVCDGPMVTLDKRVPVSLVEIPETKQKVHAVCYKEWITRNGPKCAHCSGSLIDAESPEGVPTLRFLTHQNTKVHPKCYVELNPDQKCVHCNQSLVSSGPGTNRVYRSADHGSVHEHCMPEFEKGLAGSVQIIGT